MNTLAARLLKPFPVIRSVAFVTYKEWSAYRSHMLVSLFVGPVNFLVQYFIWHAVYSTRGSLNGLSLEQMITYFGAAAVINYIIYDSADWNLNMLIHTGRFVTYIIRPMSHRLFAFSQKVGHRLLGVIIEAVPVYLIITLAFGVRLAPADPLWALLSVALGFVMYFLINYCIGIIGFWLVRAEGVRRMVQILNMVLRGTFIPLVFFPDVFQKILFFLPFQYAMYVPVRVFTGNYELAGWSFTLPQIVSIQALAVVSMFFITELLWRLGVRRFTGVGV
jgi:ABC-2 type transport system permease protein